MWLERWGVEFKAGTTVLDLGCGHGIFGGVLAKRGCQVTFADESNGLMPELAGAPFRQIDIDKGELAELGTYEVVICSNVYEHLSRPELFLQNASKIIKPGGRLFLSWTNWLSIWGGHEFSPFHYLGSRRGHRIYDKIANRPRIHTPYENLFPTYIGQTIKKIQKTPGLRVLKIVPRYYPEFSLLMHLPVLREFLAWNCAMLIAKT
ncbi:MAG: class SAM-dependent methyltransferase [Pedosphaera sp.]|nr:class SAM-dependent methyltransferase [Pedosphaera sp.]